MSEYLNELKTLMAEEGIFNEKERDNILEPGTYEFTVNDPQIKAIKKGNKFEVKKPIKAYDYILGEYLFKVKVGKDEVIVMKSIIRRVK